MWEQYWIVSAKKYATALIKGKGNWIQMDAIKTSNSHNLSMNDRKDIVYLGLDFIFIKFWKIITFHALLKSGGCWLLYCAVHLKMTFWIEHNRLHDTHFDRGVKKRDSIQVLPNCPAAATQMARPLIHKYFSAPSIFGWQSPRLSLLQNSSCHSLGQRVFTPIIAELRDARSTPRHSGKSIIF